jgi:ribulose-5-phosphate 4-epimerase/fuculose-1-phosphate aldolase
MARRQQQCQQRLAAPATEMAPTSTVTAVARRRLSRVAAALVTSDGTAAAEPTVEAVNPISDPLGQHSGITGQPMRSNPFLHPTVPMWSGEMSEFEAAARRDLAAAYRLCVEDGLNEGVCNHLTVAMPGNQEFLVVPFGLHWGEVTASRLILVNGEGTVLKGPPGATVEDTAYMIHGAMHAALGDRGRCIMHTHMPYATTLCALASDSKEPNIPLQMVHQTCGKWDGEICYEREYKGVVDSLNTDNPNEGLRLAESMGGDKRIMFARNHGVFVVGPSVAECFDDLYYLERGTTPPCLRHFTLKRIISPRQARDKHGENSKKEWRFLILVACRLTVFALSTSQPLLTIGEEPGASVHKGWVATRAEYSHAHFNSRKRLLAQPKPVPFDDL